MMESFYGGRPGNSFKITGTFASISDMESLDETKVKSGSIPNLGEYALVSTDNLSSKDNGKLFLRTAAGFQLISQIVGPAGPAPVVSIKNYDDSIEGQQVINVSNGGLVSGKNNKDIKISYESKTDTNNEKGTLDLGLQIPYTIVEFLADTAPLAAGSNPIVEAIAVEPFYSKYRVKLPKGKDGIDGISVKNVVLNSNRHLIVTLSNNQILDAGLAISDSGILTALNLTAADIGEKTILEYLSITYPNGLIAENMVGKMVTYGEEENSKDFYAFDYNANHWYFVGRIEVIISNNMIGKADDSDIETKKNELAVGGVWFIAEE